MTHTAKPWKPSDGTNPYGKPSRGGNYDEIWRRINTIPCPTCGATVRRAEVHGRQALIICGTPHE